MITALLTHILRRDDIGLISNNVHSRFLMLEVGLSSVLIVSPRPIPGLYNHLADFRLGGAFHKYFFNLNLVLLSNRVTSSVRLLGSRVTIANKAVD
jgi:hypothetical protein